MLDNRGLLQLLQTRRSMQGAEVVFAPAYVRPGLLTNGLISDRFVSFATDSSKDTTFWNDFNNRHWSFAPLTSSRERQQRDKMRRNHAYPLLPRGRGDCQHEGVGEICLLFPGVSLCDTSLLAFPHKLTSSSYNQPLPT